MSDEPESDDRAQDFLARVRTELAALLHAEPERLRPATRLVEDLKVDSLEFLSLIVRLEGAFDAELPDKEAARLRTVGEIAEALRRHSTSPVRGAA